MRGTRTRPVEFYQTHPKQIQRFDRGQDPSDLLQQRPHPLSFRELRPAPGHHLRLGTSIIPINHGNNYQNHSVKLGGP